MDAEHMYRIQGQMDKNIIKTKSNQDLAQVPYEMYGGIG